jgi:hypothetical protein
MLRNITLPFAEIATKPNSQIFPCSVLQGLRFHPWVRFRSQELTDISINLLFYTANLSANLGPKWKKEAETNKVDCSVTRSWDDKLSVRGRRGTPFSTSRTSPL